VSIFVLLVAVVVLHDINSQKCFFGSDKTVLDRNMNSCICQLVATYNVYEYKCTI